MAQPTLEFWFEFASTYSYLAVHRIEALCERAGVELVWRPFLLGPIFKQQGWDTSPFNIYAAKGAYMWRDMQRLCEQYQIPFRRPSQFPRHGLTAARVALAAAQESWCARFIRSVFDANFADDLDIANADCVVLLLEQAGCDRPEAIMERANSATTKELLRQQTQAAIASGIFGAPSFVVDGELFWGHDRMHEAIAWCRRS
jgi:2-hydroxychromene-2-carboxylate isomerase